MKKLKESAREINFSLRHPQQAKELRQANQQQAREERREEQRELRRAY